jgi:hypothetical protein
MTIKNAAVSTVLGLMFLSLLTIFMTSPPSPLITFLSVLIMLVGLIMGQSQSWRDITILASVSVIASIVAVALVASARFGMVGTLIAVLVWSLFLSALFSSARRSVIPLPHDKAILIENTFTGFVRLADGPIAAPNMPFVERIIAIIPLYELDEDVTIANVNASAPHNVDEIKMRITYKVLDPLVAAQGLPKRTQAQEDLAKQMSLGIGEALRSTAFWERLLGAEMQHEAEEVTRAIFHQNTFAQNAIEIYRSRLDLAEEIRERLNQQVRRWGARVQLLQIDSVKFDRELLRSINRKTVLENETELKEIEAKRDATRIDLVLGAEVNVEAKRVMAIIQALRNAGVEITPELVVQAIRATSDWQMQGDYDLLTQQLPQLPAQPTVRPAEKK